MCSKPKQNDCWPTGRAIFLFWSTGTLFADHRRLSVWLCACGHFFECLLDIQTLPPGSSTLISACKRSFPATDCEQWVGCETECNVETVSGNGSVSHTALYRSNLGEARSWRCSQWFWGHFVVVGHIVFEIFDTMMNLGRQKNLTLLAYWQADWNKASQMSCLRPLNTYTSFSEKNKVVLQVSHANLFI